MTYPDTFLDALGAWQRGWHEEGVARLSVTAALLAAMRQLSSPLPVTTPLPVCFRKRFLIPNNPQNGGDFEKLVVVGRIDEGIASWTTDPTFHHVFKRNPRDGQVSALFAHTPTKDQVIVDVLALWGVPAFRDAVDDYRMRCGREAEAYERIGAAQSEIILNAPLLATELIDTIGQIGDEQFFYDALGASTQEARDDIWDTLMANRIMPGAVKWAGADATQRALATARRRYMMKVAWRLKLRALRLELSCGVSNLALSQA